MAIDIRYPSVATVISEKQAEETIHGNTGDPWAVHIVVVGPGGLSMMT